MKQTNLDRAEEQTKLNNFARNSGQVDINIIVDWSDQAFLYVYKRHIIYTFEHYIAKAVIVDGVGDGLAHTHKMTNQEIENHKRAYKRFVELTKKK